MHRKFSSGFTLIELMVTIAIVAILLALGLPSFHGAMQSNRLATTNNELLASLSLARMEAIKTKRSAGVCAANSDGTACANSTDWANGWLVWSNGTDTPGYEAGTDTLLRYVQPKTGMTLTVPLSSTGEAHIIFDNRGRPRNNPTANRVINLQPETCSEGQELVREMALNAVGQVTTARAACT